MSGQQGPELMPVMPLEHAPRPDPDPAEDVAHILEWYASVTAVPVNPEGLRRIGERLAHEPRPSAARRFRWSLQALGWRDARAATRLTVRTAFGRGQVPVAARVQALALMAVIAASVTAAGAGGALLLETTTRDPHGPIPTMPSITVSPAPTTRAITPSTTERPTPERRSAPMVASTWRPTTAPAGPPSQSPAGEHDRGASPSDAGPTPRPPSSPGPGTPPKPDRPQRPDRPHKSDRTPRPERTPGRAGTPKAEATPRPTKTPKTDKTDKTARPRPTPRSIHERGGPGAERP